MWWDDVNVEPCKLIDVCKYVGKSGCKISCGRYYKARLLYSNSNLPISAYEITKLIPEKQDEKVFDICKNYQDNIQEHVQEGHGIYLHSSNAGNGKTTWAYKILHKYVEEISKTDKDGSVYYVNVAQLFEFLRVNMNNKEEVAEVEKRILGASLVIFDDLGVESPTSWVTEKLYTYVNRRYVEKKASIFTSNLSLVEVQKRLGNRIFDRILETCRPLEFKGSSRRVSKAWWNKDA
jgi:DNA replication protein DnaC